ncbi:hypothetical protein [Rhodococcus sp. W8901]
MTVDYEGTGVHAWDYWRDQLPKSWPTLQRALGLDWLPDQPVTA